MFPHSGGWQTLEWVPEGSCGLSFSGVLGIQNHFHVDQLQAEVRRLLPNLLRLWHFDILKFSLEHLDVGRQKGLCKIISDYYNEEGGKGGKRPLMHRIQQQGWFLLLCLLPFFSLTVHVLLGTQDDLFLIVIQQKLTQHCKAIILQ